MNGEWIAGSIVSSVALDLAKILLGSVSGGIVKGLGEVFVWLIDGMSSVISSTTGFEPSAIFFMREYQYVFSIAKILAIPALLVGLITSIWVGSLSEMLKSMFIKLPLIAIVSGAGITFVALGNEIVNLLCQPLYSTNSMWGSLSAQATAVENVKSAPMFIIVLVFVLGICSELALWLEFILRNGALYLLTATIPLASIGVLFPAGRLWLKRTLEVIGALLLSKFVVLLGLSISILAILNSVSTRGSAKEVISTFLSGLAMLVVSTFTPFLLLRLIPVADLQLAGMLEGSLSSALRRGHSIGARLRNYVDAPFDVDPWPDVPFMGEEMPLPGFEGYPPSEEMVNAVKVSPMARQIFGLDPNLDPTDEQVEGLMREYGVIRRDAFRAPYSDAEEGGDYAQDHDPK